MYRFVLPLCAAMFVTLLIAGEDNGQMRPGLAHALATGDQIVMVERRFSPTVVIAETPEVVKASATDLPPPVEMKDAPVIASLSPAQEPSREEAPKPVFTLSTLPQLGGDQASLEGAAESDASHGGASSLYADPSDGGALAADAAGSGPENADANGDVRTVSASSVNVRLGPSTDSSVVGRLGRGEAVLVLGAVDSEWVEVVIQGDGVSGYVASRFLTPDT